MINTLGILMLKQCHDRRNGIATKVLNFKMKQTKLYFLLYTTILFGLCTYSAIVGPDQVVTIPEVLASPVGFTNKQLNLTSDVKVAQILPGEFQVEQLGGRIAVRIPKKVEKQWEIWREQLQVGEFVSLSGVFHQEGYILLDQLHIHNGRRLKIWVSFLALLLLVAVLIYERMKSPVSHA